MASTRRVTVTLPVELLASLDRFEQSRSRFIGEAVRREVARRTREGLLRSLATPHAEALTLAEVGLRDFSASLAPGDEELVDVTGGTPVRWVEGRGWVEEPA